MYNQYLKEREGLETLETGYGFATYKMRHADCYIQDIYVLPEFRQLGLASSLADQIAIIAQREGKAFLTGSVDARAKGADISRQVLRGYGMSPYTEEGPITYYRKEI